jgi:hypothetical protein
MKTARFTARHMTVAAACLIAVGAAFAMATLATTPAPCASDISTSIRDARRAVNSGDPKQDHAALVCMIEAVAALDAKVESLRNGSTPLNGRPRTNGRVNLLETPARERK